MVGCLRFFVDVAAGEAACFASRLPEKLSGGNTVPRMSMFVGECTCSGEYVGREPNWTGGCEGGPRMSLISPVRLLKNPPNPDDTSSTLPVVEVVDCIGGAGATGGGEANKPRFITANSSSVSAPASCSLQASAICGRACIARARFSTSLGRRRPIYSFPPTKSCGPARGSEGLGHTCTRQ